MKTIFRTVKVCKYTQISNEMLRNPKLSLKAKGMLAMILTHSDEWVVTKSWLEGICLEGRDSIRSALEELQAAGYACYDGQEKDENGQFSRSSWTFFEEPRRSGKAVDRFPVDGKPATKKTISEEDCLKEEDIVGEGSPTLQPPSSPSLPQGPNNSTLEANPEAEPTGSGRETPPVPRPPLADRYTDARKVLAHLNAATGRRYRETDSNLKLIRGRLIEPGVDVGGCLQVIDRQCAKWLKDPKMAEYLRPETLFGKTKFDSYYAAKDEPVVQLTPRAPLMPRPKESWQVRRDAKEELERIEKALRMHPGYGQSDVFIPDWCTPELEADAAKLVARRKELKAILASLPSET